MVIDLKNKVITIYITIINHLYQKKQELFVVVETYINELILLQIKALKTSIFDIYITF